MANELDKILIDVRSSYRLLSEYQSRVLNVVRYIKGQSNYSNIWGRKWFSSSINTKRYSPDKEYANLNVSTDMWSWDFFYGYMFEYYMGTLSDENRIEFSVMQVADDGYFKNSGADQVKTNTFAEAKDSNTLLLMMAGRNTERNMWMRPQGKEDYEQFINSFLASSEDVVKCSDENGDFFLIKKYDIGQFANQEGADNAISDFAEMLKPLSETKIFKERFYK